MKKKVENRGLNVSRQRGQQTKVNGAVKIIICYKVAVHIYVCETEETRGEGRVLTFPGSA